MFFCLDPPIALVVVVLRSRSPRERAEPTAVRFVPVSFLLANRFDQQSSVPDEND